MILLVEGHADTSYPLCALLEHEGFEVHAVPSGEAAVEAISAGLRPRLVLLDYWLPHNTHPGLLTALRSAPDLTAIPLVIISTTHEWVNVPEALVMPKPIDVDRLIDLARRHCSDA